MASSNFFLDSEQLTIIRYALNVYWGKLAESVNTSDRLFAKSCALKLITLLDMLPYFNSGDYMVSVCKESDVDFSEL